jgi:hypothetical protein
VKSFFLNIPWRRALRALGYALYLFACVLLLVEAVYRFQWADFYRTEWQLLNESVAGAGTGKSAWLIAGDSFTADPESYAARVRDSLGSGCRVYNAAVPGTGPRQARCFLPGRIREILPEVFVYQLYVGNDLLDARHPAGGPGLNWGRRAYWWLSDRLLWLGWLNYKAGRWRSAPANTADVSDETFSPESYNAREKLILRAEPSLLAESAGVTGERGREMAELSAHVAEILDALPDSARKIVLVVPHAAQVTPEYRRCAEAIGAVFPVEKAWFAQGNPFAQYLEKTLAPGGTRVLDALPALRAAEERGIRCYYANDPHLTPDGQAVLADFLLGEK